MEGAIHECTEKTDKTIYSSLDKTRCIDLIFYFCTKSKDCKNNRNSWTQKSFVSYKMMHHNESVKS